MTSRGHWLSAYKFLRDLSWRLSSTFTAQTLTDTSAESVSPWIIYWNWKPLCLLYVTAKASTAGIALTPGRLGVGCLSWSNQIKSHSVHVREGETENLTDKQKKTSQLLLSFFTMGGQLKWILCLLATLHFMFCCCHCSLFCVLYICVFCVLVDPVFGCYTSINVCVIVQCYCVCIVDNKPSIFSLCHGLWCSVGFEMPIHACFFRPATFTRKVGQTGLVFGMRSGFTSRSVHARIEVSVFSGCDFFHSG